MKVICRTEESRPGGKGLKPGKPKKKGLLSSFGDWFGSFFFALCCLGKVPGGAPFSQLHKGGKQRRVDRP